MNVYVVVHHDEGYTTVYGVYSSQENAWKALNDMAERATK